MRANAMGRGESRRTTGTSPSTKFFRLSQLRKLRGCDQVAAVCYRVRRSDIEFLLVRTNSGHWTFPKGKAEPGLTHAQAVALEAFEEAFDEVDIVHTSIGVGIVAVDKHTVIEVENELASEMEMEIVPFED